MSNNWDDNNDWGDGQDWSGGNGYRQTGSLPHEESDVFLGRDGFNRPSGASNGFDRGFDRGSYPNGSQGRQDGSYGYQQEGQDFGQRGSGFNQQESGYNQQATAPKKLSGARRVLLSIFIGFLFFVAIMGIVLVNKKMVEPKPIAPTPSASEIRQKIAESEAREQASEVEQKVEKASESEQDELKSESEKKEEPKAEDKSDTTADTYSLGGAVSEKRVITNPVIEEQVLQNVGTIKSIEMVVENGLLVTYHVDVEMGSTVLPLIVNYEQASAWKVGDRLHVQFSKLPNEDKVVIRSIKPH